jgi:hypothetical protein
MYTPVYFKPHEWRCKCRSCSGPSANAPLCDALLRFLDLVRAAHGRSIIITSGWRCADHNAASGGALNSYHLIGQAADIWSEALPALAGISRRIASLPAFRPIELRVRGTYIHVAFRQRLEVS